LFADGVPQEIDAKGKTLKIIAESFNKPESLCAGYNKHKLIHVEV
jgi:hypothetical protein